MASFITWILLLFIYLFIIFVMELVLSVLDKTNKKVNVLDRMN